MPRALQQKIQQDLSRGSNLVTNPYLIGQQQRILDINLLLDEHGSLRTRAGTLIQTLSPDTPSGGVIPTVRPIVKIYNFVRQDGLIFPLAILQGNPLFATTNKLFDYASTPWTPAGSFAQAEDLPDILTFTNLALICNGYETPRSFDGAVLTPLTATGGQTVPGGAKHHALHQGFYWVWNTAAVSGTLDGPTSLRSSDLNNPNSWPNANQLFIDKDDGDRGSGMGQFTIAESGISPTTSQILFKNFVAYQMTGVFGSTNPLFTIQKIKSDMGCIAPRTIRFAPGFGLIRLTHRGFALFDGVDDRLISEEVRPLLFGGEGFTGLDWDNASLSYSVVVANPPLYVCWTPTDGPGLNRVFCYDLVRRAWTVLVFANRVSTVQAIVEPDTLPVILGGDFDHAAIRRYFAGDTTDDAIPIVWQTLLRPISGASPQQNAFFRRMILKVTGITVGQQITGVFIFGPSGQSGGTGSDVVGSVAVAPGQVSVTVPGTFGSAYQVKAQTSWLTTRGVAKSPTGFVATFGTPAPPGVGGTLYYSVRLAVQLFPRSLQKTITAPVNVGPNVLTIGYGIQPYGTSPYGGISALGPEMDMTFNLGQIGTNARAFLLGQGPVTIRGIEWHVRSKPLSRPSVYV